MPDAWASCTKLRVGPSPHGLGECVFSTAPIVKGEIVLEEVPLLVGESFSALPPIAAFAPIPKDELAVPMPSDVPCIGSDGWPAVSVFDNQHLGLVLAWIEAPEPVKLKVFERLQQSFESAGHADCRVAASATTGVRAATSNDAERRADSEATVVGMEADVDATHSSRNGHIDVNGRRSFSPLHDTDPKIFAGAFSAGTGALIEHPQLPTESAAAACCRHAAEILKQRGPPWLAEDWGAPPSLLAEHEVGNAANGGLLGTLLRIFCINGHQFSGSAALFEIIPKLNHVCHNPLMHYATDPAQGIGTLVATQDIPDPGTMLTTSYLGVKLSQSSTPQRRRLLYCQKGFICKCMSCESRPDWYRRILRRVPVDAYCSTASTDPQYLVELHGVWYVVIDPLSDGAMPYIDQEDAGIQSSDPAVASQLKAETRLAAAAIRLLHNETALDGGPGRRLLANELDAVLKLEEDCVAVLGNKHFATQAARRVGLAQQMHDIRNTGKNPADFAEWTVAIDECQAYIEQCETCWEEV